MDGRDTWGVLVVHGVGDTEPGDSLAALLPGILQRGTLKESGPVEGRMLVEPPSGLPRTDDLHPPPYADESGIEGDRRFPAYFRTFTNTAAGQPERVVFAEVFWADLSRAGSGRLDVLRRAIGLVFDLRHVSDVASAFPGMPLARTLRVGLYAVSWLICGPIAGFAAFLLALLLARYLAAGVHDLLIKVPIGEREAEGAILIFGLLAIAALFWFRNWRTRSAWAADGAWRLFSAWAFAAAATSVMLAAARLWISDSYPWQRTYGGLLMRHLVLDQAPATAMETHLIVLLGMAYAAFAALAMACIACFALWLAARLQARGKWRAAGPALDAALGVSLLQVLLWVVIGAGIASVVLHRFVPQYTKVLVSLDIALTLELAVLAVIALSALIVWIRRALWARKPQPTAIPRLLINPLIMAALIGITLLSVAIFGWAFITGDPDLYRRLAPWATYAKTAGFLLAFLVSVPFLLKGVRNALHILIDVTSHFYRPRLQPWGEVKPGDFSIQQRIEARFRRALQELCAPGQRVTHLTILAHSQGTVIALDVLWLEWARNLLAGRKVRLVTMGSPITHLYQHYFPHRYPALFLGGRLNPAWGEWLDTTVSEWLNVYRIDDYIGKEVIGGGRFPLNSPSTAGGHTGYWSDKNVGDILRKAGVLPGK